MKGLFITFEGPEGSGKSTHCKLLAEALRERSISAIVVREPGSTEVGEEIRKIIKRDFKKYPMCNLTELFLFEAARAQLVLELIEPALARGITVLCDRFADSTVVYQGYGRGLEKEKIFELNKIATNNLQPDITFLLDIMPEEGLERINARGVNDRIEKESLAFHNKIRAGYLEMARLFPSRFKIIDTALPQGEVYKQILEITLNAIFKS
jgi:dTMP kinase